MLKRPRDPNQLGKLVVDIATGQVEDQAPEAKPVHQGGRRGGLKGGPARAQALDPAERSRTARVAAKARWEE